jgi:hypothetical protein
MAAVTSCTNALFSVFLIICMERKMQWRVCGAANGRGEGGGGGLKVFPSLIFKSSKSDER